MLSLSDRLVLERKKEVLHQQRITTRNTIEELTKLELTLKIAFDGLEAVLLEKSDDKTDKACLITALKM